MNDRRFFIILATLAIAGCANDPAPNTQLQLTEQAVAQAVSVGADSQMPEMQLAQEKLALAQKNMGEADYKRARFLAEQAELDARLAEVKVLVSKSAAQLAEMKMRITALRKQLGGQQ